MWSNTYISSTNTTTTNVSAHFAKKYGYIFFSLIILSLRFNQSQNKTQFTVLQQSGQHIFKELAHNVKTLTTSMRIESNDNQMK